MLLHCNNTVILIERDHTYKLLVRFEGGPPLVRYKPLVCALAGLERDYRSRIGTLWFGLNTEARKSRDLT